MTIVLLALSILALFCAGVLVLYLVFGDSTYFLQRLGAFCVSTGFGVAAIVWYAYAGNGAKMLVIVGVAMWADRFFDAFVATDSSWRRHQERRQALR